MLHFFLTLVASHQEILCFLCFYIPTNLLSKSSYRFCFYLRQDIHIFNQRSSQTDVFHSIQMTQDSLRPFQLPIINSCLKATAIKSSCFRPFFTEKFFVCRLCYSPRPSTSATFACADHVLCIMYAAPSNSVSPYCATAGLTVPHPLVARTQAATLHV